MIVIQELTDRIFFLIRHPARPGSPHELRDLYAGGIDNSEPATLPIKRIPFQPGASMAEVFSRYGSEERCTAARQALR